MLIPHEEVISQLEADTLNTDACLGVKGSKFNCGGYPQVVRVCIKVSVKLLNIHFLCILCISLYEVLLNCKLHID